MAPPTRADDAGPRSTGAAKSKGPRSSARKRRWRRRIRRALLVCVAIVCVNELVWVGRVARLRWVDPGPSAMMQHRAEVVGDDFTLDQRWVGLEEISPNLVRAVIAGEDIHFATHHGIDYGAMIDAARANRAQGRVVSGGSTITQQLAKNLFLSPTQSYLRKAREAVLAYELELLLSKARIMEIYLNVIEWDEGIYGAEAAAQHYLRQSAEPLTRWQAAHLAAIIPGPRNALNPRKNPARHHAARTRILRAMRHVEPSRR